MPFLDDLIGVHDVSANGQAPVKRRALLNFVGASVVIQDNEILGATNVTLSAATGSTITPPALSGTVNDFGPADVADAAVIRLFGVTAVSLTGFVFSTGQFSRPVIINVGAATISLVHQSNGSAAGNRFITANGANYDLLPGGTVEIVRDITDSRWRVVS